MLEQLIRNITAIAALKFSTETLLPKNRAGSSTNEIFKTFIGNSYVRWERNQSVMEEL
jgi:hypothetical protein